MTPILVTFVAILLLPFGAMAAPQTAVEPKNLQEFSDEPSLSDEDNKRYKKSPYPNEGNLVCVHVENGPDGYPVTVCRDQGYQGHGSPYGQYGTVYGPGLQSGYGLPVYGGPALHGSYGLASYGPSGLQGHGSYGSINSSPLGYGSSSRPDLHGLQAGYNGNHGGGYGLPHQPVPHYRSDELEMADSIVRHVMEALKESRPAADSLSARTSQGAYGPSAGNLHGLQTGYSNNYGSAVSQFPHATYDTSVPLLLGCQPNIFKGGPVHQGYQPNHGYGRPGYRDIDTEKRDEVAPFKELKNDAVSKSATNDKAAVDKMNELPATSETMKELAARKKAIEQATAMDSLKRV